MLLPGETISPALSFAYTSVESHQTRLPKQELNTDNRHTRPRRFFVCFGLVLICFCKAKLALYEDPWEQSSNINSVWTSSPDPGQEVREAGVGDGVWKEVEGAGLGGLTERVTWPWFLGGSSRQRTREEGLMDTEDAGLLGCSQEASGVDKVKWSGDPGGQGLPGHWADSGFCSMQW